MLRKYTLNYRCYGQTWESHALENEDYTLEITDEPERLRVVLHPKHTLQLLDFSVSFYYEFRAQDWFYAGGYQSWTTSREYKSTEVQKNYIPLAKMSAFTRHLAGISADSSFVDYPEKPGEFHSHCYTYIRNRDKVKVFGSLDEKTGYTIWGIPCSFLKMWDDMLAKRVMTLCMGLVLCAGLFKMCWKTLCRRQF